MTTELGLPGRPFDYSFKHHSKLVTNCWWQDIWREIDATPIRLEAKTAELQLQRANDQFLMSEFIRHGFKNKRLVRLNRCRVYLQVYTLADVCTGDGRKLISAIMDGRNPMKGSSRLQWPNQGQLPPADWKLWRSALQKCFLVQRTQLRIRTPLGNWLLTAPPNWPCWYNVDDHSVYLAEGVQWRQFTPTRQGPLLRPLFTPNLLSETLPPNTLQAIGWISDGSLTFTGRARQQNTNRPIPTSIDDAIASYDTSLQWALPYIECPDALLPIASGIRDGTAIAVTDGSFKLQRGTSAFTLVDLASGTQLTGANHVPGICTDHCSYRSELTGILGTVILIDIVCGFFGITSGHVTIGCDNLEAGRHGISFESPPSPSDDHFDIISAIFAIKRRLPVQLTYRHVEGHQREKYPGRPLDSWALLNDDMDTLAKAYWLICHRNHTPLRQSICQDEWAVWIGPKKICKNFKQAIRDKLQTDRLEKWWKSTKKLTESQIRSIDFAAARQAWKNVWPARRRYVSKFSTNYSPVGRNMRRWHFWKTNQCPRCLAPNETCDHVLQCPDPRADTTRRLAFASLSKRMDDIKTAPLIQDALLTVLNCWITDDGIPTDFTADIQGALDKQLALGWDQFFRGRIAIQWQQMQSAHFEALQLRQTGQKWASLLIMAVWEFTWTLWDHRNDVLHNSDVHDQLLDMDATDLAIIEEWHAGGTELIPMDRMQWKGIDLETLLAKSSRFRRDWLSFVQTARVANQIQPDDNDES